MNKDYYKSKITHMVQDNNFYVKKTWQMPWKTNNDKNKTTRMWTLSRDLTSKENDYLINLENNESQFYGLPVHKFYEIKHAI